MLLLHTSSHDELSKRALSGSFLREQPKRPKKKTRRADRFNTKVMKPFWIKAQTVIHPAKLKFYKQEWRVAGDDMVTVLQTLETRWQELRSERRYLPVLNSRE